MDKPQNNTGTNKVAFDANGPGINNGSYFGLPFSPEESRLVLLSVPWEVTTSYGGGTSAAPDAIIEASLQLDLYDVHNPDGWMQGIGSIPIEEKIFRENERLRAEARKVILHLEEGGAPDAEPIRRRAARVNEGSEWLNDYVYSQSAEWLEKGKVVGLVGGDHSVPFGLIRAAAEKYPGLGVLHIDAHADLRDAYEGFTHSHASIMHNVMTRIPHIGSLVQVGVRDFCDEEKNFSRSDERINIFTDYCIADSRFHGESWDTIVSRMIDCLPGQVYVSFDIDGLSPENCPHTGTPVPGGLGFNEAVHLLNRVVESGRRIVGFDLCEVAPGPDDQWDANVGARILYKLCNLTLKSTVGKYADLG